MRILTPRSAVQGLATTLCIAELLDLAVTWPIYTYSAADLLIDNEIVKRFGRLLICFLAECWMKD